MHRAKTTLLRLVAITAFVAISMLLSSRDSFALTTEFYGNVTTFPISRTVTSDWAEERANLITNTFYYTISTPNTAPLNPSGITGPTGEPTDAEIIFSEVTPTSPSPGTSLRATRTAYIDFSNTIYDSVGTYYYIVRETGSSNTNLYPIDNERDKRFIIQVDVVYEVDEVTNVPNNNKLIATINQTAIPVMDSEEPGGNPVEGEKQPAYWSADRRLTAIGAGAITYGNIALTSECFEYTIYIPVGGSVSSGDQFTLQVITSADYHTPSDCPVDGVSNAFYTITAGETLSFYMRHNDAMYTVIPTGVNYTLTAVVDAGDGYVASVDGSTSNLSVTKRPIYGTTNDLIDDFTNRESTDNTTLFTRTKNSDVLAGIFTNIWLYVILLAMVAIGVFVVIKHSRKQNDFSISL